MARGNKKHGQNRADAKANTKGDADIDEVVVLRNKLAALEKRVETLESMNAVMAEVNKHLQKEVDRLDQYGRRHSIVIRNVELPAEKEKPEEIQEMVNNIISKDMKCATEAKDIDKTHRVGRVRTLDNGKKAQNIVVRFRSHKSRYNVYFKKDNLKNGLKIGPHLTNHRGKLLYDSQFASDIDGVEFTYANLHGDICVRLSTAFKERQVHQFTSLEELNQILVEADLIDADDE